MSDLHDPRVLFAAERTQLAWNRTSVSLMAFGFVVERFGLFLNVLGKKEVLLMELDCHGRCFFMDISCRAFTVGAWGALADRRIGSCVYWNIPAPGNKGYYSFPADLNFIKNLDPPVFVA